MKIKVSNRKEDGSMERLIVSKKDLSNFDEVAICVAVCEGKIIHATTVEDSMIELKELVQATGCDVKAEIILHQEIDENYYLDKETLEYIIRQCDDLGVSMLVFIDSLTGKQIKNIEELSGKKVVDRTMLLLEILSSRSNRREIKLEIEKSQLLYRLERLEGFQGIYKYGSGICINNPNGRRLLTDEEKIREKLDSLDTELSITVKNRFVQRSKKSERELPLVAFMGYTNCGKSSIMNKLIELDPDYSEESSVIVEDMMLSTLDMSLRKSTLPNGRKYLIVDTVGFVSDLPDELNISFTSTFEELGYADLIIKVFDSSSENLDIQRKVIDHTIDEIGIKDKRSITLYNKCDKLDAVPESDNENIYVSTHSGHNMDVLLNRIGEILFEKETQAELMIPYNKHEVFNKLKEIRAIEIEDFKMTPEGIKLSIVLNTSEYEEYKEYIL